MIITEDDRREFRYATDSTIRGFKLIKRLPDRVLGEVYEDEGRFEKMRLAIGRNSNPSWLRARLADEMYTRGLIDEKTFDYLAGL